jgi:CRP-like cAMP-binding protein
MPITAKLSKAFYERLGDAAANELVDWLNAVDNDYRSQLRELNELNFARFDAKVEQRFAQADAKMERRFAEHDVKLEQRFAQVDARFAQLDVRFAEFETRLTTRMFVFYTGQTVGLAALIYAMLHGR